MVEITTVVQEYLRKHYFSLVKLELNFVLQSIPNICLEFFFDLFFSFARKAIHDVNEFGMIKTNEKDSVILKILENS